MTLSVGKTSYVKEEDGRERVFFEYDGVVYDCGLRSTSNLLKIMPYVRDEISVGGVYTSSGRRNQDAYDVRLGYVIDVGLGCFPENVFAWGVDCKVGDWISYHRHCVVIDCIIDPRPAEQREVFADGVTSNKDLIVGIIADNAISSCYGKCDPSMINTNYHIGK